MPKEKTVLGKRRNAAKNEPRASYQARRVEISHAAARVFNRLGYTGASLSAIAAELGIDRATLYYYFASKEQLFDEIIRAVIEENDALARRIADSPISPARKMRELVSALMISYATNYPLLYIYIREDPRLVSDARSDWSDRMRELSKSIQKSFVDIIEQGYGDGTFRRVGSPKVVANLILGMLNWTHRWFKPGQTEPAEEVGKTVAEMVLSGLESPY